MFLLSLQITIGTGLDFSGTPAEGTGVGAPQTEGATTVGAGEGPASDGDKRKQPSSAGPSRSASPGASRRSRRESTDSSKHRKTESHSRAGTHERSTATGDSSKPANTSDLSDAVAASLARRRRRRMRRRRTFVDSDRSDIDSGDDEGTSLLSEITKKFNPVSFVWLDSLYPCVLVISFACASICLTAGCACYYWGNLSKKRSVANMTEQSLLVYCSPLLAWRAP